MFIDTHAHLMMKQFEGEVDELVLRAHAAGVEKIVNIGLDVLTSEEALVLSEKYEGCFATFGFHPYEAAGITDAIMADWETKIRANEKIIGVGECGMDFVKTDVSREVQEKAFRMQLELAKACEVPVVVHSRGAEKECLDILKEYKVEAVFHCYGGDVSLARQIWYEGFYTSFTGIITFSSAEALCGVVSEVPLDMFMIETDCPFLAPQEYRGKRNEPAYVVEVAKKVAELKRMSLPEIERIALKNTEQFFLRLI